MTHSFPAAHLYLFLLHLPSAQPLPALNSDPTHPVVRRIQSVTPRLPPLWASVAVQVQQQSGNRESRPSGGRSRVSKHAGNALSDQFNGNLGRRRVCHRETRRLSASHIAHHVPLPNVAHLQARAARTVHHHCATQTAEGCGVQRRPHRACRGDVLQHTGEQPRHFCRKASKPSNSTAPHVRTCVQDGCCIGAGGLGHRYPDLTPRVLGDLRAEGERG